jgi:RNA processing factor Prp31
MKIEEKSDVEALRQRAEELLKKAPLDLGLSFFESDSLKIIHELEVQQIELELQHEELLQANELVADINKKFNELFDLHNRLILHFLKHKTPLN